MACLGSVLLIDNTVDLSGGNGINLILDGVTGGPNVTTSNSTITNSGGIGVNRSADGATLGTVTLDPIVVTNSGTAAASDGVRVDLTNARFDALVGDALTITSSTARGLDVILNGATGGDITITNTTSTNSDGRGISVAGVGATLGNISLTNVSSDHTTAEEGVAVVLSGGVSVGDITLTN